MSTTSNKRAGAVISLVISAVMLVLAGLVIVNRQAVFDTAVGFFYTPSSEVVSLTDDLTLTGTGQRIFYATQPQVSSADAFNTQCPRQEVMNPIVGCYTSDDRIYLYSISNGDLDGIEEVTAAHEMLHAAWSRLNGPQQDDLESLLVATYNSIVDGKLKDRMAYYERTEPGEFANELHSIIGTEVTDLSPELEAHYAQYFSNRAQIVTYFNQYDAVYQELYDQSDALYQQLDALGAEIQSATKDYEAAVAQFNADTEEYNQRTKSGKYSVSVLTAEYNSILVRQNQLEADRAAINQNVVRYNDLRDQYISVASEIERLNDSVDSYDSLTETPSVQ